MKQKIKLEKDPILIKLPLKTWLPLKHQDA